MYFLNKKLFYFYLNDLLFIMIENLIFDPKNFLD